MIEKGVIISFRNLPDTDLVLTGYGCNARNCNWSLPPSIPFHEALRIYGQKHNSLVHFNNEAYLKQIYQRGTPPKQLEKHFSFKNNWEIIIYNG